MTNRIRTAALTAMVFTILALPTVGATARQAVAPAPVPVEKPVLRDWPYDGSGSRSNPTALGVGYDPVSWELGREKSEKERKALASRAATGTADDVTEWAARLEQGDYYHAPDRVAALDLYEKAADRGNKVAQQKICIAYLLGEGRPVNVDKGLDYGAALGKRDPVGIFSAGFDYETGASGPKDMDRARAAYIEAGKHGSGDAMDALGRLSLADGKPEAARHLFREGTYLGSADAMDHLASMVEKGEGGPMDAAEAYWLYVQAGLHGNAHAAAWVAALPVDTQPLNRAIMIKNKAYTRITRTWIDNGPRNTQTFTLVSFLQTLAQLPWLANSDNITGTVTMYCYVGADSVVDACVVSSETPPGYHFAAMVEWLFDSHLVLDAQDVAGQPTAHSVFAFTVNYVVEGGHL